MVRTICKYAYVNRGYGAYIQNKYAHNVFFFSFLNSATAHGVHTYKHTPTQSFETSCPKLAMLQTVEMNTQEKADAVLDYTYLVEVLLLHCSVVEALL